MPLVTTVACRATRRHRGRERFEALLIVILFGTFLASHHVLTHATAFLHHLLHIFVADFDCRLLDEFEVFVLLLIVVFHVVLCVVRSSFLCCALNPLVTVLRGPVSSRVRS